MYIFSVTVHLIDYPTDAPFNDGTGIDISGSNYVDIVIDLFDLCSSEDNVLKFDIKEDTTDSDYDYETDPVFELFAIIGSRNKTSGSALYSRTYPGYKDEITMEFSGAQGGNLCPAIAYSFTFTDTPVVSSDYLSIERNRESDDNQFIVTYGTDEASLWGTHRPEISAHVEDERFKHIKNEDIHYLAITFFECTTDLQMDDFEYQLSSTAILIELPELQFQPPLHQDETTWYEDQGDGTFVKQTQSGGAFILNEVFYLENDEFVPLPQDLGKLDTTTNSFITIETSNAVYIGINDLKVIFTGQGYLDG